MKCVVRQVRHRCLRDVEVDLLGGVRHRDERVVAHGGRPRRQIQPLAAVAVQVCVTVPLHLRCGLPRVPHEGRRSAFVGLHLEHGGGLDGGVVPELATDPKMPQGAHGGNAALPLLPTGYEARP